MTEVAIVMSVTTITIYWKSSITVYSHYYDCSDYFYIVTIYYDSRVQFVTILTAVRVVTVVTNVIVVLVTVVTIVTIFTIVIVVTNLTE